MCVGASSASSGDCSVPDSLHFLVPPSLEVDFMWVWRGSGLASRCPGPRGSGVDLGLDLVWLPARCTGPRGSGVDLGLDLAWLPGVVVPVSQVLTRCGSLKSEPWLSALAHKSLHFICIAAPGVMGTPDA